MPIPPPRDDEFEQSTLKSALGKAIAIRRLELGIKRNDLRDRSGLSYPYIAELENGSKAASSKALGQIANALDLSVSELLARAEDLRGVGPAEASFCATSDDTDAPLLREAARPVRSARSGGLGESDGVVRSESARRWFGADQRPAARRASLARSRADSAPDSEPLTEERVREIVRDELHRHGLTRS